MENQNQQFLFEIQNQSDSIVFSFVNQVEHRHNKMNRLHHQILLVLLCVSVVTQALDLSKLHSKTDPPLTPRYERFVFLSTSLFIYETISIQHSTHTHTHSLKHRDVDTHWGSAYKSTSDPTKFTDGKAFQTIHSKTGNGEDVITERLIACGVEKYPDGTDRYPCPSSTKRDIRPYIKGLDHIGTGFDILTGNQKEPLFEWYVVFEENLYLFLTNIYSSLSGTHRTSIWRRTIPACTTASRRYRSSSR